MKCLRKRIPESADGFFGKYQLHIVFLASFPGSSPAAEMLWRSLGMRPGNEATVFPHDYSCLHSRLVFRLHDY